jgi:hypothetical protein
LGKLVRMREPTALEQYQPRTNSDSAAMYYEVSGVFSLQGSHMSPSVEVHSQELG